MSLFNYPKITNEVPEPEPIDRTNYKHQRWQVKQGTNLEENTKLELHDPNVIHTLNLYETGTNPSGLFKSPHSQYSNSFYSGSGSNKQSYNMNFPSRLPQWIKYDKNVLNFKGYFTEHVVESAYENFRFRKCNIFYYLDDDTMHIDELREENSGIVQGYFIKRQRCPKEGTKDDYITWRDFNLQSEIFLFGKKFRICSCDDFTNQFYIKHNILLNPPEPLPELNFEDKFKNVDFEQSKKNIAEIKEYVEVSLKGGHPNNGLKQFLENDRKVLNFDISWYDDKYDKEEKLYKMNYYLADSKIEIREIKVPNNGKDPFPLMLHKMKLPKKPQFTYCPGLLTKEDIYYQPKDLILGNFVYVYGRPCRLVDCDDFTRKWYKDNFGIDMEPIKVQQKEAKKVEHPIPPHNGFGSEEDSLLNVFYLNPQGKVHDYYTAKFKRDKHILRFNAKLISPIPSDEERKFILSYYVRDEAIQIYEIGEKNSGRQSCKFLEKSRQKNQHTGKYYEEKDMTVGNIIYLNKFTFRLLECDDYTKKYMRDNAEIFGESDCSGVIEKIKIGQSKYNSVEAYLVDVLRVIDPNNKSFVSSDEILEGLKYFGINLTTQELVTLCENLDRDKNTGKYSMEDLYNLIVCYK